MGSAILSDGFVIGSCALTPSGDGRVVWRGPASSKFGFHKVGIKRSRATQEHAGKDYTPDNPALNSLKMCAGEIHVGREGAAEHVLTNRGKSRR